MFTRLLAICLLVDNFETSFNFYTQSLGFEVKTHEGNFAEVKFKDITVALFEKSEAVAMFPKRYMNKGGGVVIAVQSDHFEETIEQLKKQGVEIIEGPKTTEWGQTVAYFKDPDSNIWEVSKK